MPAKQTAAYWKARAMRAEKLLRRFKAATDKYFGDAVEGELPELPAKPKQHADTKLAVDYFDRKFFASYTRKPLWDGKTVTMVDSLVKRTSLDEFKSRVDYMFRGHLPWLAKPYTMATLRQHWDKFIPVESVDPREEWGKVARLVSMCGRTQPKKAQAIMANFHPTTQQVVSDWSWFGVCNAKKEYAEAEFIRRWRQVSK